MTAAFDEHAARAARTYGSAADHFDRPALGFWDRFGAETVARARLAPGQRVLDLCCGAGASAIPAAHAVGPAGQVLGVDVADPLLDLARARAARQRLSQLEFRCCDARRTGLPDDAFDAVLCVFGVFFVADMPAFVAEMWRMVCPGGTLAVTTWGSDLFEPASGSFWHAVRQIEPELYRAFNPWDEITTTDALTNLFTRAGVPDCQAVAVPGDHVLKAPEQFWDVVMGSGYRATVDALSDTQRATLYRAVVESLESEQITAIRTDVIFGIANRSGTRFT